MTRQARNGYQKHPKAAWGFALLLALIGAAVLIPFASGSGRPPTYTFTGDRGACAGASSAKFDVVLKNTSSTPQNLGSADLYAPQNISLATGSTTIDGGGSSAQVTTYPTAPSSLPGESAPRSLISLRNLTVPSGSFVTVHVSASVAGTGKSSWYSIVKQANSFNPGSLDTSNAFTLQGSNPYFDIETCTLQFVTQPPNPWQKGSTAAAQNSFPVEVAVYSGASKVAFSGTPDLAVTSGSAGGTSDFSFGSPTYNSSTLSWTWPDAMPNSTAPHGSYNLDATLGLMTATSDSDPNTVGTQPFQVVDQLCQPGQLCTGESNPDPNAEGTGIVTLTDPFAGPVLLNFGQPDPVVANTCSPWNRAYYTDSTGTPVYFPSEELNYNWGSKMLQVTFYVRNSEWVQTNVSRGNQDADFCVGARHQFETNLNGDGTNPTAFVGKYADGVHWHDGYYWGVLATVSNPSKVKTDGTGSPAICQRGTTYLNTGPDGASELWRFWTACIPYDWDYASKGP